MIVLDEVPALQTSRQALLRHFLPWLIVLTTLFLVFALLLAATLRAAEFRVASLLIGGYLGCLLLARRELQHDRVTSAILLATVSLLVVAVIGSAILPELQTVLILLPINAAALALQYLRRRPLFALFGASLASVAAIILISENALGHVLEQPWSFLAFRLSLTLAVLVVLLQLLYLARRQIIELLTSVTRFNHDLKESEQRFRQLAENIESILWVADVADAKFLYIGPRYEEIWRAPISELYADPRAWLRSAHPEDRERLNALFAESVQGNHTPSIEYRILWPDGQVRWIRSKTVAIANEAGQIYRLAGVSDDITAQKEAESALLQAHSVLEQRVAERTAELTQANAELQAQIAERERAEAVLCAQETTLSAIVNSSPDLIAILSFDGLFQLVSPASESILGFQPADLRGSNAFDYIHPADIEQVQEIFQAVVDGRRKDGHSRFRYLRADSSWTMMEARARLMLDHNDQPTGVVVIAHDIEQQVRLESDLRQAKIEAEQANLAKSEFLSRMSHELRTPLNAILGFAQLLEMDDLPGAERQSVQHILNGGQHLLALVNEVLDITGIEAGRLSLSPEPISCAELIDEVADMLRPLQQQQGLALQVVDDAADCYIRGDRQRFRQVLLNLLSNAIKYNRAGGRVTVTTGLVADQRLRIAVADSGIGIAQSKLERLFTPFERLGAEQYGVEGTGLGLALSKRLVEAMGGSLGVVSAVGEGSTFWIEFPLVDAPLAQAEASIAQEPITASRRGYQEQVLLIEDNLANLDLVRYILKQDGRAEVLTAMDGMRGVQLARQYRPKLILLDIHLPDIDGEEVLQRLQSEVETRDIPVVVLSADATPRRIERLLAAGVHEYLSKPIDVRRFLKLLTQLLPDTAAANASASPTGSNG